MADSQAELKSSFGEGLKWPETAPREVGTPTQLVMAAAAQRAPVRAIYGGTEVMRGHGKMYLPQEPGETNPAYESRLQRTFLYNGISRTVQVLGGKPFARPIDIGDDVPPLITEWIENIDNTGRHLNIFARDVFMDALLDGVSYFLVDMQAEPKDEQGNVVKINRSDQRAKEKRVYWVQYRADDVLGWKTEIRGGRLFLSQLRLKLDLTVDRGDFTEEEVEGVMVLVPGGWAQYVPIEDDEEGRYRLMASGDTSINYIPIVPVYAKRLAYMLGSPPLLDLAFLNLAHWQSSSDQRHILHVARVPLLFAKGWVSAPGDKLEIGPNRLITQENSDASLEYVEIRGTAIDAGRDDLKDLMEQMGDVAMRLLLPKTGDITATQTGVEAAEAHSALQAMAEGLQDSLEIGTAYSADIWGITSGGGSLKVYTDFGIALHDSEVGKMLAEAEAKGQISRETMWSEWKRRNILSDAFDEVEEADRLEESSKDENDQLAGLAGLMAAGKDKMPVADGDDAGAVEAAEGGDA